MHQSLLISAIAVVVGLVVGYIMPTFSLDGAIKKRKTAIARRLPDLLDMVSTTVEAGTALNGALAIAVTRLEGPLADEFRMTLSDIRVGVNRADALTALSRRVKQIDLASVVTALVQTERLGGNVAQVLDELAEERALAPPQPRRRAGREDPRQDGDPDGALHAAGAHGDDLRPGGRATAEQMIRIPVVLAAAGFAAAAALGIGCALRHRRRRSAARRAARSARAGALAHHRQRGTRRDRRGAAG